MNRLVFSFFSIVIFLVVATVMHFAEDSVGLTPEQKIEEVVKLQFSKHDEEMMKYIQSSKDGITYTHKLDEHVRFMNGYYMNEQTLNEYMEKYGTNYHRSAHSNGYVLSLRGIEVEQIQSEPEEYRFTVSVGYQKGENEEMIADVEGFAGYSKYDSRITKFSYTNDNGLAEALQN